MIRYLLSALVVLIGAGASFYYGSGYFSGLALEEKSPTEVASPLSDTMANVLAPTDVLTAGEVAEARPWTAPDYSGQAGALGWSEEAFAVPASMRTRVDFWKLIYSKYSTDEGVLHDPVTLEVYEPIRFPAYHPGDSLSAMGRARSHAVDLRRAAIAEQLLVKQAKLDKERANALMTPFDVSADPQKYAKAAARIRFQLGQRDKTFRGIYDSGHYLSLMEKIFRDEGLPIELTRLPFVESSFNTRARSKVGASGIWQFMRRTAKPYMKINQSLDERNDPLTATRAAARMMKSNFQLLRNWPLAVTAWNHGPSGVRNITLKLRTDDLGTIVSTYSSRTFGFASQNFYACFLAMLEVERDARTYFAKPVWESEFKFDEIKTPGHVTNWPTVLKLFGDNDALARDYNPQFSEYARTTKPRISPGTLLRVPPGVTWSLAEPARVASSRVKSRSAVKSESAHVSAPAATSAAPADAMAIVQPSATAIPGMTAAAASPSPSATPQPTASPAGTPAQTSTPTPPPQTPPEATPSTGTSETSPAAD